MIQLMPYYGKWRVFLCIRHKSRPPDLLPPPIPPFVAAHYNGVTMHIDALHMLRLLQLADSGLPVGAAAHSFGLETLVADGLLTVATIEDTLGTLLSETGTIDALACREAYRLGAASGSVDWMEHWTLLNGRLSALKQARESRSASTAMGRRLLRQLGDLESFAPVTAARGAGEAHYSAAFGLACGALGTGEDAAVLALLEQSLAGLVSACQRLLPLGQSGGQQIRWRLNATLAQIAERSAVLHWNAPALSAFTPLVELGSMRHPSLATRLFIS